MPSIAVLPLYLSQSCDCFSFCDLHPSTPSKIIRYDCVFE